MRGGGGFGGWVYGGSQAASRFGKSRIPFLPQPFYPPLPTRLEEGGGGGGSSGAGEDYGGFRDMNYVIEEGVDRGSGTNPRVSSSRSRRQMVSKVCAVVYEGLDYGVFILNLDDNVDAGADRVVNLRGKEDGFVNIDPNLVIKGSHNCFCGLNGNLYMIEGVSGLPQVAKLQSEKLLIYKIEILPEYECAKNLVLDSDKVVMVSRMKNHKLVPAAVRCEDGILIFSRSFAYAPSHPSEVQGNAKVGDFELFNPYTLRTVTLPGLYIYRSFTACGGCQFWLVNADSDSQPQLITPRFKSRLRIDAEFARSSFTITAFSMIDPANLVVQTDFGGLFRLGLHSPTWQVFEGTKLPHYHENILTKDSKLVVHPSGASGFSTSASGDGRQICRLFPLSSSIPPNCIGRNFAIGLSENPEHPCYVLSILQVRFDNEMPYWTLDVVELDASEFEEAAPENLIEIWSADQIIQIHIGPLWLPFCSRVLVSILVVKNFICLCLELVKN